MANIESEMTDRLLAISEEVPHGAKIVDVGCDHGYVSIYLALKGRILSAVATDVNEGPLCRARRNIEKFGVGNIVKTCLSDGLKQVDMSNINTVIIAGMGGLLISEILDGADLSNAETFILQPMTAQYELRKYLYKNGFIIEKETLAKEEEKLYTVLKCKKGQALPMDEIYFHTGKNEDDPLFIELIDKHIKKISIEINGLKGSKEVEKYERKKELFELYRSLKERMKKDDSTL